MMFLNVLQYLPFKEDIINLNIINMGRNISIPTLMKY